MTGVKSLRLRLATPVLQATVALASGAPQISRKKGVTAAPYSSNMAAVALAFDTGCIALFSRRK